MTDATAKVSMLVVFVLVVVQRLGTLGAEIAPIILVAMPAFENRKLGSRC